MNIVHFADAHIGVTTHGRIDADTGMNDRVLDFLDAFDFIIDYIEDNAIDLVLFAGDMFHSNTPSPSLISEAALRIKEISNACPIVLIPGNHDQAISRVSALQFFQELQLTNVYISDKPCMYTINDVLIGAVPYPRPQHYNTPVGDNVALMDAVSQQILAWHGLFDNHEVKLLIGHFSALGAQYGAYKGMILGADATLMLEHLEGWDYVALGHIHCHQELAKCVTYSGSIERVDFGEEHEGKGFVHITIDGGQVGYKFIPIPCRPLVTLRYYGLDTQAIIKAIAREKIHPDAIVRLFAEYDGPLNQRDIEQALKFVYRLTSVSLVNTSLALKERVRIEGNLMALSEDEQMEIYLQSVGVAEDEIDEVFKLWEELDEPTN